MVETEDSNATVLKGSQLNLPINVGLMVKGSNPAAGITYFLFKRANFSFQFSRLFM